MSSESESHPNAVPAVTATRFDRNGETVFNLALRITGSPGAAWHATVAAFAAVAERVPPDAPAGTDDRDLLLMGCWHARQMLSQLEASPEYAAQLRAHDEAQPPLAGLQGAVVRANLLLPVDQREVLALRGLSDLDHADLAVLLRADPGLLAAMLAQSRLMLHDALRGTQLTGAALADPEDRQPIALAALRQDGQLRGAEARLTLATWLEEGGDARQEVIDALEEAGLSYRAWEPVPVPDGLADAVVAGVTGVVAPTATGATHDPAAVAAAAAAAHDPGLGAPEPDDDEGFPAGEHDRPVTPEPAAEAPAGRPGSGPTAGPVAPRGAGPAQPGPVDPHATVEWSSSDIAALGLEGAPAAGAAASTPGAGPAAVPLAASAGGPILPDDDASRDQWDDGWDGDSSGEDYATPREDRRRAPRWQIALVGILLVAVIVVLVIMFTQSDSPTPATPPTTTTNPTTTTKKKSSKDKSKSKTSTTRTTGAAPSGTERAAIRLPHATIRLVA